MSNTEYNKKLLSFVNKLNGVFNNEVTVQTGRKYDKVSIQGNVRYFVQKIDRDNLRSGDILGAKSKFAPNPRWFFGSLDSVELWDWSGHHAVPVNDPNVTEVKGYGDYKHYKRK